MEYLVSVLWDIWYSDSESPTLDLMLKLVQIKCGKASLIFNELGDKRT